MINYLCLDIHKKGFGAVKDKLTEQSYRHDSLTGLPNMSYFFELAESGRETLSARGGHPALLYFDLCGMKYYNHKYGFAEGDNLLRSFADLLSRTFGEENCGHIGADHFTVIADETGIEEKLNILFQEWLDMSTNSHLPVFVGICPQWTDVLPVANAYDRAKIACDALRGTYSSCFNYHSSELVDEIKKQQYILDNFNRALSEKWIKVYYQPIMRAINSRICDDEALARWDDPVKGVLAPIDFIPHLEDAGLIYKLDLYVLEQVLDDMKTQEAEGLYIVPHSINLSRSDFDSCDIVEEITKRVDASGISRNNISIELTESVIGSDFDFMKTQVKRFRELGFQVWMDDFGSGYSSMDVLQSIRFDLIKFDMNFMRKLDENDAGRIILKELMKMATSLGVDTICEGVETEEQARFLQEIGCSKLQGYYFSEPIPFGESLKWHKDHQYDGYENPVESSYYESICSVNLFDLGVIAQDVEESIENAFSTLPMGIIEIQGDSTRFLRTNQSYRDFFKRFFDIDISTLGPEFVPYDADFMYNFVKKCCEQGERSFFDEKMSDGSVIHSFARRLSSNPVNGNDAVAVAVLSISKPDEGTTYVDIARALAADYYCMYVVDLDTEQYIEYSSPVGGQAMAMEQHGEDFFEASMKASYRVYEEDREEFFSLFNKKQIIEILDEQGVFTTTYRLMDTGRPVWVNMKITRLQPSKNKIIIGVSDIDSQMKQKEHHEELRKEQAALVRVMALADGYLGLYTIDPETDHYIEFTSSEDYAKLGAPKEGEDFFRQLIDNVSRYLHIDDQNEFVNHFSREAVMNAIDEKGFFSMRYRIMMEGEPRPVMLRIAPFTEGGKTKLLVGIRRWIERRSAPSL